MGYLCIHTYVQIDRLFDWQRNPNSGVRETIKRQKVNTKDQFDERVKLAVREFAEKVSMYIHTSIVHTLYVYMSVLYIHVSVLYIHTHT